MTIEVYGMYMELPGNERFLSFDREIFLLLYFLYYVTLSLKSLKVVAMLFSGASLQTTLWQSIILSSV